MNLVCSFDLMPGLVVDIFGVGHIVMEVARDHDHEVAAVTFNGPGGDFVLEISWAQPDHIEVIGVSPTREPDTIKYFDTNRPRTR